MSEEATLPTGQEQPPAAQEAPTDYREFVRWREGATPSPKEPAAPAAAGEGAAPAPEPQAKTEPDSEPEDSQDTEEDDDTDGPKRRSDSRTRKIDRLTRENAELRGRLSALEERKPHAEEPGKKQPKAPAEGEPQLDDYDSLQAYQSALTDWKLDEREKARAARQAEQEAIEAHEKLQNAWAKKERAAAKVHDDFNDVVDSVSVPKGPGVDAARQAMLEDEHGAEILYYLGKHPEDLKRIAALSPVSAVREIGKLSALVSPAATPENGKPKVTSAPKPPPGSVRPSKAIPESLDDPEVLKDYPRWRRLREAQLGRR